MILSIKDSKGIVKDYNLKDFKDSKVKAEVNTIIEKIAKIEVIKESLQQIIETQNLELGQLIKHIK